MALGARYDIKTPEDRLVEIAGSFAPNGNSAVSSSSIKGEDIASVARSATGTFTITFSRVWPDFRSFTASLQLASADDKYVQVGTYTAASKTLVIRVMDAGDGAAADVDADDNNRIHFKAVFSYAS